MTDNPRLKLVDVERYERDVRLRLPFRFGVTTVTHATQAVIRATIGPYSAPNSPPGRAIASTAVGRMRSE